ncbi:ABC transporter permease [Anthocerotibacter panamensis]|uniref:ABC transporter permease n=1 Tax=Anthocerotibacter panamensis TaxID=2857077 RepID=UPI001C40295A|nr:ABC transporter permease [Anthocerotibacter panamensis]
MKRVWTQCLKELAQFRRDWLTVALAFLLPFITLMIFSFAIRLEAKDIPLVIQDLDRTPFSRAYAERFWANGQFRAVQSDGRDPGQQALDRGWAKAALIIPSGFERQIKAGRTNAVQVVVDGTDSNNARVIKNSIQATTRFFLQTEGFQPQQSLVVPHIRFWFNPGRKEALYIVPGVYAVVLWIFPSLLAALAMVREKEQGTIIQVYASSLSAVELILGKGLAYFIVALGETFVIIGLGSLIFRVGFAGDPTPMLLGMVFYLAAAVLFGLLLGARAGSQSVAVQGVATVGFLTALLLSGFIYPVSNIPFPLSLISAVVPARYYIELTRDAFVRGTGWPGVWYAPLFLAIQAGVLFNGVRRNLQRMQLKG